MKFSTLEWYGSIFVLVVFVGFLGLLVYLKQCVGLPGHNHGLDFGAVRGTEDHHEH